MTVTYDSIATTTLGSAASTITFSSIPATFTDLRLVLNWKQPSSDSVYFYLNNDNTNTIYSRTVLRGNGTVVDVAGSITSIALMFITSGVDGAQWSLGTLDLFSYAGSTNKTILGTLSNDQNGAGFVTNSVYLARTTSAITRIDLVASSNFSIGTTATLYGIKSE